MGRPARQPRLPPEHIHEDLGLFADIDHLLDKPARGATPEVLAMANAYLGFIRDHETFPTSDALIEAYAKRLEAGTDEAERPAVAAGGGG